MRILARSDAQYELVEIERTKQRVTVEIEAGRRRLDLGQRGQFATSVPADPDWNQRLQQRARRARALTPHAARD